MKLNKKSKITVVLLTITLTLWGGILYNIVLYFVAQDGEEKEIVVKDAGFNIKNEKHNIAEDEISYQEISRDPFVLRVKEPVIEELPPIKPVLPAKPKLQYTIAGTIITSTNKLVVFEDRSNNKTLFLREGDEYNGIKITSVTNDHIKIMEDKTITEIKTTK